MRKRAAQSYLGPDAASLPGAASRIEAPVFRVQLVREGSREARRAVETARDAAAVVAGHLADVDREHFVVLMLDAQNRLLGIHTAGIGTLTAVLVSPREVFKAAVLANAASVIVGHNHPSGDPTPSAEDFAITDVLRAAGKLLDIPVLDHVVVGEEGKYVSIKRRYETSTGLCTPF